MTSDVWKKYIGKELTLCGRCYYLIEDCHCPVRQLLFEFMNQTNTVADSD